MDTPAEFFGADDLLEVIFAKYNKPFGIECDDC